MPKIQVLVTATDNVYGIVIDQLVEVSVEAMRGRPDYEINAIIDLYIKDWLIAQMRAHWQIVDQGSFGLEYMPSESVK